jgi:transposase InsO family protein
LSRIEKINCSTNINYEKLAEDQDTDSELKSLQSKSNLKFKYITLPGGQQPIACETSTSKVRPYLPNAYRFAAFKAQHDLSHPGVRITRKIVTSKFFWPSMNKDVGLWAKSCIGCQRAKVHRHVTSPHGEFLSSSRFEHVHVDIVGPLPQSNDFRYCVTMIDRCTKWPEAVPTRDITAETVAKAVYEGWIARFGCPLRITTDQGRQFESSLFNSLMKKFGITRIRTTAFHPQANGQVERWHRSLKSALMAKGAHTRWSEELHSVLLGLRTALNEKTKVSPALMTYGSTLRIPSDFFVPTPSKIEDAEFVKRLSETMSSLSPVTSTRHGKQHTFVYKDLATCSHVFIRNDTARSPLIPPYDGPYEVLERYDKYFKLQLPRRVSVVTIDRLKPAHLFNDGVTSTATPVPTPPCITPTSPRITEAPETVTAASSSYITKSGRAVKPNVRFA